VSETDGEYPGLRLTDKGEAILFGRESIALRPEAPRKASRDQRRREAGSAVEGLDPSDEALFQHLRSLRASIAREEGVAAFIVFPDRTLIDMARLKPIDLFAMRAVSGVGERKLAAYGARFAEAVRGFLAQ
jgi:ATP-dependent DNA helicase RecQ